MGKFSFSLPGRRKPPSPQLTDGRPLSKAHKILGSTPINIDAPVYLENASSSAIDISSAGGRHLSPDDAFLDAHMRLAVSEGEWDDDSDPPSAGLRFNAIGSAPGHGDRRLKKSQSSSTIRSRYDKSKQLQSISRQTSTPTMPNSLPLRSHPVYDSHAFDDSSKTKKKPPMLDFSNLKPGSRLSRKGSHGQLDGAIPHSLTHPSKSTSVLSPFSSSGRHSDKRGTLKRLTKESILSLLSDGSGSNSSGSNRREGLSDSGLSTLYHHYEEMSLLRVMKQGRASEDSSHPRTDHIETQEEVEWKEAQVEQDLDWLHKPIPDTPQTPFIPESKSLAPGIRAKRISEKYNKTPKGSRYTDKGAQEADFHDKSVLILSDSEDEVHTNQTIKNRTYTPNRRPSEMRTSFSRFEEFKPEPLRIHRSSKRHSRKLSSGRASDGSSNSYTTIPSTEMNYSAPIHSSPRAPSPRESLSSSNSTASGMTCQLGYGAQEPQSMTVLPARRPSQAELEQEAARVRAADSVIHVMPHESVPTSPDQLTPPLSPTSVDFYLRSARSSIDAAGPQNRIMAVTREEEMLISALRKKNQAMRESAKLEAEALMLSGRRRSKERESGSSQATITQTPTFDFGFPAPPNFHMKPHRPSEATVLSQIPLEKSDATSRKPSQEATRQGSQDTTHQDVFVYLDQGKTGWNDTSASDGGFDKPSGLTPDFQPISWGHSENDPSTGRRDSVPPKARLQPSRLQTDDIPLTSQRLATLSEHDLEDVPRPDSPISPESFPPLPVNRIKASNMARLSAVGWSRPPNEPQWGDDD
ncbi:hypothetical protein PT974_11925 [Cladobotryum mycophilum]|uniref:Uncharacterized protein n=1 Tax=Cladobotryum mycophilum TaxID=491253 RepID=A0ABR0S6L3_9HYPO